MLVQVSVGDAQQNAAEAGTAVAVAGRKISATVKRLAIGSEKRGKRPSALAAHGLHGNLIAAVNVRALVAIHLHGDEMLVYDRGDFGIVVRFAVHHMAPVAPHCANVEQHRFVVALRRGKRLFAPLAPLDGLMHGGAQVCG